MLERTGEIRCFPPMTRRTLFLLLLALAWRLLVSRSPSAADLWKFHANNTTTVHYKNGVTCYYHQEWRQMSCVYSNETYGPKEY